MWASYGYLVLNYTNDINFNVDGKTGCVGLRRDSNLSPVLSMSILYIYICVCVCVCVCIFKILVILEYS